MYQEGFPQWLFIPAHEGASVPLSTTAGAFRVEYGLREGNPFEAVTPSLQTRELKKKRLVISDYSLRSLIPYTFRKIVRLIFELHHLDFQIVIVGTDKRVEPFFEKDAPKKTVEEYWADPAIIKRVYDLLLNSIAVSEDTLAQLDPDYTADGTAILHFTRIRELFTLLDNGLEGVTTTQVETGFGVTKHNPFIALFYEHVVPYYNETGLTLEGQVLPEIELNYSDLSALISSDYMHMLRWGFTFTIMGLQALKLCMETPEFPHDKIVGLYVRCAERLLKREYLFPELGPVVKNSLQKLIVRADMKPSKAIKSLIDKLGISNLRILRVSSYVDAIDLDRLMQAAPRAEVLMLVDSVITPCSSPLKSVKELVWRFRGKETLENINAMIQVVERCPELKSLDLSMVSKDVVVMISSSADSSIKLKEIKSIAIRPAKAEVDVTPSVSSLVKRCLQRPSVNSRFKETYQEEKLRLELAGRAIGYNHLEINAYNLIERFVKTEDWERLNAEKYITVICSDVIPVDLNLFEESTSVHTLQFNLDEINDSSASQIVAVARKFPNLMYIYAFPKVRTDKVRGDAINLALCLQDYSGNKYGDQIYANLYCCFIDDNNIVTDISIEQSFKRIRPPHHKFQHLYDRESEPKGTRSVSWQDAESTPQWRIPVCKVLVPSTEPCVIRHNAFTLVNGVEVDIAPVFGSLPEASNLIPTHEFSYHDQFVKTSEGKYRLRLRMLTPQDIIPNVDSPEGELKYSTSDNFYYLERSTDPGNVLTHYMLHSPKQVVPPHLLKYAEAYKKPFENDKRTEVVRGVADVNVNPQYYNCVQRCAAFYETFQNNNPRISGGGGHCRIELQDNEKWYLLDLGGKPIPEFYRDPVSESGSQTIGKEQRSTPDTHSSLYIHPELFSGGALDSQLNSDAPNTLLVFGCPEDLEKAKLHIARIKSESVIEINGFSELQTTSKYIALEGDSAMIQTPPGGWLVNQLSDESKNLIMIDWSAFSPREAAQSNTCLDKAEKRKIQNLSLGKDKRIVGLLLKDSPLLQDSSFISRHHQRVFHVSSAAIPVEGEFTPRYSDHPEYPVQLYSSKDWLSLLMGKIELVDGRLIHTKGPLLQHRPRNLHLENPPLENKDFRRFMKRLSHGLPIRYHDKTYQFEPMAIRITQGYDFSKVTTIIKSEIPDAYDDMLPEDVFVINASTVERAIKTTRVEGNKLITEPGWVESCRENEINVFISSPLSEHQRMLFLDEVQRCRKTIHLYTAPSASPATEPRFATHSSPQTHQIRSDALIIDVSGLSPDDLTYGYSAHLKGTHFEFEEKTSDIWLALEAGKHVYLTGHFSDELIDHLSTMLLSQGYLWKEGKKKSFPGKLYLCPSQPFARLAWLRRANGVIVHMNLAPRNIPNLQANEPVSGALAFHQSRVNALDTVLSSEPAVLIHGEPGIGKSSFIHFLKETMQRKVFSENQLQAWASYQGDDPVYLVIDEATTRDSDFPMFEGLYTPSPVLLIQAKIYPIKNNQKVIFLGNRVPDMPRLFRQVAKLRFNHMSADHIIEYILKPIFSNTETATQHYRENSTSNARVIQAKAIAVCAEQNPSYCMPKKLEHFILTESRRPLVESLVNFLNAREIMMLTHQYGGQTGFWIEGPPGIGKTEIIQAVLDHLKIDYTLLPASTEPEALMHGIRTAFQQGCIVVIDELDTALNDSRIAEINAYLMGEDLNFERPQKNGFALLATGNGPKFTGRLALPAPLLSRMICHKLGQYPEADCFQICSALFPNLHWAVQEQTRIHLANPSQFTFRALITHLSSLASMAPPTARLYLPSLNSNDETVCAHRLKREFPF